MNTLAAQDIPLQSLKSWGRTAPIIRTLWQLLLLTGVLFWLQPAHISYYDESIILTGALQWLDGQMPAVDYYTVYGPLQFYVLSQLLNITDNSFMIARLYYAFTLAIPVIILSSLIPGTARLGSYLRLSYVSAMVLFCLWFASAYYPSHSLPLLFAILLLVKLKLDDNISLLTSTGVLTLLLACVFLLRPTIGIMLAAGLLVAIPFDAFNKGQFRRTQLIRDSLSLFFAVLIAGLLALIVDIQTQGSVSSILHIVLSVQSDIYPKMRALPFPNLLASGAGNIDGRMIIAAYLPLACIAGGSLCYLLFIFGRLMLSTKEAQLLFWQLFLATLLFSLGLVRTDGAHLLPAMIFSMPIGYHVYLIVIRHVGVHNMPKMPAGILMSLPGVLLLFAAVTTYSQVQLSRSSLLFSCLSDKMTYLPNQGCLMVDGNMRVMLPALEKILESGEKIFSANSRHDKILTNNLSYYSASGHMPIGYWAHMDPGVQTTAPVQQEIVNELKAHASRQGRSVVVVAQTHFRNEPNGSAFSSGVTLLDDFLAQCPELFEHRGARILECTMLPVAIQ